MAGRRRKPKTLLPVGSILMQALTKAGLSDQARRLTIYQQWAAAVGPKIAARTAPESFSRGVLRVRAQSAAWQNELTFLKRQIIDKLNSAIGQNMVHDVRVVVGVLPKPSDPEAPLAPLPSASSQQRELARQCAAPITDEELRGTFERAMCRDLVRRRRDP